MPAPSPRTNVGAKPITVPPAANAPSMPSTRPRTTGVDPTNFQPSTIVRRTPVCSSRGAFVCGITSDQIVAAETRNVSAFSHSASAAGLAMK